MRKQCPSCLSNKGISPLHRLGLLMRDKDECPPFLPQNNRGNITQGSLSFTLTALHELKKNHPTDLRAVKLLLRQLANVSLKSIIAFHCQHHCSQWIPHWLHLVLLILLTLPMLFPWVSQEATNTHTRREKGRWRGSPGSPPGLFNKLFKQVSN